MAELIEEVRDGLDRVHLSFEKPSVEGLGTTLGGDGIRVFANKFDDGVGFDHQAEEHRLIFADVGIDQWDVEVGGILPWEGLGLADAEADLCEVALVGQPAFAFLVASIDIVHDRREPATFGLGGIAETDGTEDVVGQRVGPFLGVNHGLPFTGERMVVPQLYLSHKSK